MFVKILKLLIVCSSMSCFGSLAFFIGSYIAPDSWQIASVWVENRMMYCIAIVVAVGVFIAANKLGMSIERNNQLRANN